MGLALAPAVDTLILYQHLHHIHPSTDKVYQDMILCGPFGQGSFALQILGEAVVKGSFAKYNRGTILTAAAAGPIGYMSEFLGLVVWGYGVFWWCLAILSICHMLGDKGWRALGFSLSTWSMIFSMGECESASSLCSSNQRQGVFTNAPVEFGNIMDSPACRVVSTGLLLLLLVMWIGAQVLTVWGIITGRILGLQQGWRGKGKTVTSTATDNHLRQAKEA